MYHHEVVISVGGGEARTCRWVYEPLIAWTTQTASNSASLRAIAARDVYDAGGDLLTNGIYPASPELARAAEFVEDYSDFNQ
jgi:hypothetical protein